MIGSRTDLPSELSSEEVTSPDAEVIAPIPLLWHSNAPWVGTGYGQQTALFGPLIDEELDYRVAFSAFFGLKGSRIGWVAASGKGYMVYPGGQNNYGNDVLGAHAQHWFASEGGLIVTLTDPWVLDPRIGVKLPMVAWTPVDHDPLMPRTDAWLKESRAIAVAMSKFGKRVLEEAGHKQVQYVPHGYDPRVFTPYEQGAARKVLGIPKTAFVVGMVAANNGVPSRKSFAQAFMAFSHFQKKHPEALLYLHTKLEAANGEDLPSMIHQMNIKAMAADQYSLTIGAPGSLMATTFSAFDVLLNPSTGEGFGVPLLEAQACGVPVISTNWSSMPEVAPKKAGNWLVGGQEVYTPFHSIQVTPSIEELEHCLELAYSQTEKQRKARQIRVWKHAQNYHAADITRDNWRPTLENAAIEFAYRKQLMIRHEDNEL